MVSSLPLTFLRPMALPRASTIHRYLGARPSSTSTTTTTTTTPASIVLPAAPPQPSSSSSSSSSTTPAARPYRITLTPSKKYPIYNLAKRGGNKKLTRVKRIEGDVSELRKDLQEALGMDGKDVVINQLTKQIIVKGHMKPQIQQFFENNPAVVA